MSDHKSRMEEGLKIAVRYEPTRHRTRFVVRIDGHVEDIIYRPGDLGERDRNRWISNIKKEFMATKTK